MENVTDCNCYFEVVSFLFLDSREEKKKSVAEDAASVGRQEQKKRPRA